ncbi:BKACE family enzyme [Halobellus rufus]|uniref:3-keto-5-aminohexanoate cleavage protein n=1 Tax=Halobellus rufus TaxID=1448860 RepID=UPI0006786BD6|nr:3-keto-5-aminohexanoate cleavage protein [Halobellus rufus]
MRQFEPLILNCAITGAIHVPSMSPHLPVTPEEIADEAVAAADAGASIVHIHVRDPETGEPTMDHDLFRQVVEDISNRCDAIVQPTTGGDPNMTVKERVQVVPELEPELATCNMGSMNFGLYHIPDHFEEFQYDWEEAYLESTRDLVFKNTFEDLQTLLPIFDEHDTKPELECYDVGHLYNARLMVDQGYLDMPVHLQFVMGINGGVGATPKNLVHMVDVAEELFGDEFSFSVIGAGKDEFPLGAQAMRMGGHVRVGMEDNLYLRRGELAKGNSDLVEKAVDLNDELTGRPIATPEQAREFLGLKGKQEW